MRAPRDPRVRVPVQDPRARSRLGVADDQHATGGVAVQDQLEVQGLTGQALRGAEDRGHLAEGGLQQVGGRRVVVEARAVDRDLTRRRRPDRAVFRRDRRAADGGDLVGAKAAENGVSPSRSRLPLSAFELHLGRCRGPRQPFALVPPGRTIRRRLPAKPLRQLLNLDAYGEFHVNTIIQ